jgi:hypothetical protein
MSVSEELNLIHPQELTETEEFKKPKKDKSIDSSICCEDWIEVHLDPYWKMIMNIPYADKTVEAVEKMAQKTKEKAKEVFKWGCKLIDGFINS